jgi:hypothetical protein
MVTGIATVAIAGFTWILVTINNRQIDDARIVQRAFISITPLSEVPPDQSTGHFAAIFENQGTTETRDLRYTIDSKMTFAELPDTFIFVDDETKLRRSFIGPKGKVLSRHVPEGSGLSKDDISDIIDEKKFFYVFGELKYFDAFEGTKEHITQFCYEVRLQRGGGPNFMNGSFFPSMCASHNCADNECNAK